MTRNLRAHYLIRIIWSHVRRGGEDRQTTRARVQSAAESNKTMLWEQ